MVHFLPFFLGLGGPSGASCGTTTPLPLSGGAAGFKSRLIASSRRSSEMQVKVHHWSSSYTTFGSQLAASEARGTWLVSLTDRARQRAARVTGAVTLGATPERQPEEYTRSRAPGLAYQILRHKLNLTYSLPFGAWSLDASRPAAQEKEGQVSITTPPSRGAEACVPEWSRVFLMNNDVRRCPYSLLLLDAGCTAGCDDDDDDDDKG